jgi:3-deoxy-manno-octulosonate cytidylyltransferase (CMP-KDO synthetase)
MRIVGVIPARLGSSRFPGKPLAPILGRPMIEHIYWRARMCDLLSAVYVATCDTEVVEATERFGGQALMTSDKHERASDRVAEVAGSIEADIYVLIQGDEPMITPEMVTAAVEPMLSNPEIVCTNLAAQITSVEDFEDRNTIKVVMASDGRALYFSREPIPTRQRLPFGTIPAFKQVCIIPFRRDFLHTYSSLPPTPLEQAESVDMMRALEHGYPVHLVRTETQTHAVDTPADLALVESLMRDDPRVGRYPA